MPRTREEKNIAKGGQVSLKEAESLKRELLTQYFHNELEITGSYAIKTFSIVLNVVTDYVKNNRPRCMTFTGGSEDRARLYKKMVERRFPGVRIEERVDDWGGGSEFQVCFTGDDNG